MDAGYGYGFIICPIYSHRIRKLCGWEGIAKAGAFLHTGNSNREEQLDVPRGIMCSALPPALQPVGWGLEISIIKACVRSRSVATAAAAWDAGTSGCSCS